jgi:hypothetical protein
MYPKGQEKLPEESALALGKIQIDGCSRAIIKKLMDTMMLFNLG